VLEPGPHQLFVGRHASSHSHSPCCRRIKSLASALDPPEHIVKELMIQTGDGVLVKYDNDIFPGDVKATEEGEEKCQS